MNIPPLVALSMISALAMLGRRFVVAGGRVRVRNFAAHPSAFATAQYQETALPVMTMAPCAALIGLNEEAEFVARTVLVEAGYTVVMLGTGAEAFDLLAGDDYVIAICAMPDDEFRASRLLRLIRLLDLSTTFIMIGRENDPVWRQRQLDAGARMVLSPPLRATLLSDALMQIKATPARWLGAPMGMTLSDTAAVIDRRSILGVPPRMVFRIARSMLDATERLLIEAQQGAWSRVTVMARILRGMADCVGAKPLITTCNLLEALGPSSDLQGQWPMLRQALENTLDRTLDALWLTQRQSGDWFSSRRRD